MVSRDHRFGFVALAGRPNVGKSTLVNRVMGDLAAANDEKPNLSHIYDPGRSDGPARHAGTA